MSNFTNTLFLTFACNNAPIKYNWWNLSLWLSESANKYFKVRMEAFGEEVSQNNPLFFRSCLTTILNVSWYRLPSDWMLYFYTCMHGVTGSPLSGYSTRKEWLLIRFLISFWDAFSQGFYISFENLVISKNFLGSEMKWDRISNIDSSQGVNYCEISFTTLLNILCELLPIFHETSNFLCLMWPRIL